MGRVPLGAACEQTDAFKAEHGVATTPQVFICDNRIGGHDDLRRFLGKKVFDPKATYRPVVVLFSLTALTAMAASYAVRRRLHYPFRRMVHCIFDGGARHAKLQNVESFATIFLNYYLLAKRWVLYSYICPYPEGLAGVLMVASALNWLSVPVALFIGAVSVFKAVYIDRRALKCVGVGGASNVPRGFISLTENLRMIAMAVWMAAAELATCRSGV